MCDNLKAGITKPSRYEPGINRTYQDLADHHGFVVLPTRVRKAIIGKTGLGNRHPERGLRAIGKWGLGLLSRARGVASR